MNIPRSYRFFIAAAFLFSALATFASHNRAGEITYKWLAGYTYEIKITTYTNTYNTNADRCYDTLYFGDGTFEAVPRSNGVTGNLCGPGVGDGDMIAPGIKKNEYITQHTFPGPNCYTLTMGDPNRNAGVLNIPNSSTVPFFIKSELCIGTFSGPNSSPILTNPPIDDACVGNCFQHNAGAYDLDGDSISYQLTICLGDGGQPVFGYSIPAGVTIDALTGDFLWCSPNSQGEYNFAFLIIEWRKDLDGIYHQVGYVLRDLQVTVGACNNIAPSLQSINDTCIVAGSTLMINASASDPDPGQIITLSSYGGAYSSASSPATFTSLPSSSPVTGTFSWNTNCSHVRLQPYMVTIKAEDNGQPIQLIDFETFFVNVIAPAPTNLQVQPSGAGMQLTWNNTVCSGGDNDLYRYLIYRADSCITWTPGPCERGVPSGLGYTLIGFTNGVNDTTFFDNNNGQGLNHGTDYSYIVVAQYGDGALSFASVNVCAHLLKDVPIITNADVLQTDVSNGEIVVAWALPVVDAANPDRLDTVAFPGPYEFRLMHHTGFTGTFSQVHSISKSYFAQFSALSDTSFNHTGINTVSGPHTYRVDFYCNGVLKGSTQTASSVYLTATPSDNKISLSWNFADPWTNYMFYVLRESAPGSNIWNVIDSIIQKTYTDSALVNGQTYCYKILAKGQYADPEILRPLFNNSQEVCSSPIDKEPPCQPALLLSADCNSEQVMLKWTNPNNYCSDDALRYRIYFKPTPDEPFVLLDSVNVITDTIYLFEGTTSIAGCFAVTAIDSFNNESQIVSEVCTDNCPEYELPNIITINGDGINDLFIPVKNKFVKDIDLKIFDRWGTLVFETTDAAINWDGKHKMSKQHCSNGTYFYVCTVNEIRLKGIETRELKGWFQIVDK